MAARQIASCFWQKVCRKACEDYSVQVGLCNPSWPRYHAWQFLWSKALTRSRKPGLAPGGDGWRVLDDDGPNCEPAGAIQFRSECDNRLRSHVGGSFHTCSIALDLLPVDDSPSSMAFAHCNAPCARHRFLRQGGAAICLADRPTGLFSWLGCASLRLGLLFLSPGLFG